MDETHAGHTYLLCHQFKILNKAIALLDFNRTPHKIIIIGRKMDGLNLLRRTCVKGSKTEYDMKKMVNVLLYSLLVMFRSSWRPSIFAFPMFVRSKKEMRYKRASHGMS